MATIVKINQQGLNNILNIAKEHRLDIGEELAEEAKTLAPRKTGKLADSIVVRDSEEVTKVIAEADYALYVEYGTRNSPAQPYLRPAISNIKSKHN